MPTRETVVRRDSKMFAELCGEILRGGRSVAFTVEGESMRPNLAPGDVVTVAPATKEEVAPGDVALGRAEEGFVVHRVAENCKGSREVVMRGDTGLENHEVTEILGRIEGRENAAGIERFNLVQTQVVHPLRSSFRRLLMGISRRARGCANVLGVIGFVAAVSIICGPKALAQSADLSIAQVASVSSIAAGGTVTYTETVTNNGTSNLAANTVVVYQQTPANTTFRSQAGTNWTCTNGSGGGLNNGYTGPIICTFAAALNSGNSANTLTIRLTVTAGTASGTTIQNSTSVTSGTTDPTPSNNTAVTSVLVETAGQSDLAVSMTASPTPVFISGNLTYSITVQNLGLANATGVNLTDSIPAGTTFVSASAGCTYAAPTVTCALGNINANASSSAQIVLTAPSSAGPISNTASVPTTNDPVTTNNSATVITVVQPIVCATPGKDGYANSLTGIVNAYYPATATAAAGSTSITLGAAAAGGAQTAISAGDLLLVMQMQDAAINSTNTGAYGDGTPGDPATGSTQLNSSGLYEFVTATNAVPVTGGSVSFTSTGSSGGLLNTYTIAAASGTQGQRVFQVIRVPQYISVTLTSGLKAMAWNGTTGGVLAIDVSSQMALGGSVVAVDGMGFRGGGGRILTGGTGANTDYLTLATDATNGSKGEGIAGVPRYLAPATIAIATTATDTGIEGLPNGSYSRGAPGNAGGGGTDGDPPANDENSGGGAGGNGGAGGYGGYGWNSFTVLNSTNGGFGGAAFPANASDLVMGGGGGAGTTNNGSYYISGTNHNNNCGANCTGIYSSGGAGGGIVMMHAGAVYGTSTSTGTITANGLGTLSTDNDSTGGGGAGGSILIFANSGGLTYLTVNANGGSAGNAWPEQTPASFPDSRHGPGGGGGGGVIFLTAAPTASTVTGGSNGYTNTVQDSYGATPGQAGFVSTAHIITETPGTQSGGYCGTVDLSVTNSGSPAAVAPGATITYTQSVKNNSTLDAVNAVFTEVVPTNTTFQSISAPSGWSCTTPAVNGTGTITCTAPLVSGGATANFSVVVAVTNSTPTGTQISDTDSVTSGSFDPNLSNNSATVTTTVSAATNADLAITNTPSSPTTLAGSNVTMTAVITNNGPAAAANPTFTETIPTNTTLGAVVSPPAGWTCNSIPVGGTGTITCSATTLASGGSATIPVVLKVNAATTSGTTIIATGTITSSTPDANPANNVSNASTVVATAGQADLAVTSTATPNAVVTQGNNISYAQTVTNNGPAIASVATFTDTIPANTTLVSFTPPANWTCNSIAAGGTGTFTCTLNLGQMLASGASVNFPMVVKVNPTTASGTTITNTANINVPCSAATDPNCSNNSAPTSVVVASPNQADVSITKTASPEPVQQGTTLTYNLAISNNGPAIAQGVTVQDNIPSTVTYLSYSSTQATCTTTAVSITSPYASTLQLNCTVTNPISVGGQVVITVTTTASTFSSNSLTTNTATVSTSITTDPNSSNNSSTATSTIESPSAVDLTLFRAIQEADGSVMLEWRTQAETRNLGFHVYREDAAGRHRVSQGLIAGAALLLRGNRAEHAGKTYRWVDTQPAIGAVYWIEDVDVNGTQTLHGPAHVSAGNAPELAAADAPQQVAAHQISPQLNNPQNAARMLPWGTPRKRPKWPIIPIPPTNPAGFNETNYTAVKIAVDHEGWYSVPFSQLVSAGLSPNTNTGSLHLFAEGVEQPINLTASGTLGGTTGALEFYGTGIDTPFSADRVYWLLSDSQAAHTMGQTPSANAGTSASSSFSFTTILQQRTTYFAALLNGEDNDNFFGAVVTNQPVDQQLSAPNFDNTSSLPITLDLTLQGGVDGQPHQVSVQFNGANIGELDFAGLTLASQSFTVEPSLVLNGANTVTLAALQGDNDVSVVQSLVLHYPHTFTADGDWLKATVPAGTSVQIAGFSNAQIRVFDITDTLNINEIAGNVTQNAGTYQVQVILPASGPEMHTLLAFSADSVATPVSLTAHAPDTLKTNHAGADMIIVAHPDFAASLAPLVQLRTSQGHQVALVTTDQIYDDYNFGEKSPFAIRAFLQDAAVNWSVKPQFVLLVGDATFDPRDYLGLGSFDFVPTRMIQTAAFKTASDDWFTDFQQTGYATIATGRIPARTPADVQLVVSKIVNYEQQTSAGPWQGQAYFIADQNVDANFTNAASAAASTAPSNVTANTIFTDAIGSQAARSQILAALNNGALLVNYDGHGSEQQWSFSDLLDTNDAPVLSNGGKLPVILIMDCLNGYFEDVYAPSLAESLLMAPNGGAVAVWASSGLTDPGPQVTMNQSLLQNFHQQPSQTIGQLVLKAKSTTTDNDVRRTWILFGDPAMKLQMGVQPSAGSAGRSRTPSPAGPAAPKAGCGASRECKGERLEQ